MCLRVYCASDAGKAVEQAHAASIGKSVIRAWNKTETETHKIAPIPSRTDTIPRSVGSNTPFTATASNNVAHCTAIAFVPSARVNACAA